MTLADYGTDQFSIRINDKGNDIVVKPLQSFSFKSITPFQTKFKTPIKKNNKTLHQQSLLLNNIYTQDFQNLTPPSHLTQHYKQKTILLSTSRHLTPHTKICFCNKCTNKFTISNTLFTDYTFL